MASNINSGTIPLGDGAAILVHGGAWDIPVAETEAHVAGMKRALESGRAVLESGGSALAVVVEAVATMEDSGVFDAGRGSVLTRKGTVEMDAGLMRGNDLAFGSVARVSTVKNPVRAAAALLHDGRGQVRLLVGEDAERFATKKGLGSLEPEDAVHPRELERWKDLRNRERYHTSDSFVLSVDHPKGTVGCVARDGEGRAAAATSTGGTPFRPTGRVGDSPLPGCGFYADLAGAASATGWGEAIAAAGLSGRVVRDLEGGESPEEAIRCQLERMRNRISNPQGESAAAGLILMSSGGNAAWGYNTPRMARAAWSAELGFWAAL